MILVCKFYMVLALRALQLCVYYFSNGCLSALKVVRNYYNTFDSYTDY